MKLVEKEIRDGLIFMLLVLTLLTGCSKTAGSNEEKIKSITEKEKVTFMIVQPFSGHVAIRTSGDNILLSSDLGKTWQLVPSPKKVSGFLAVTAGGDVVTYRKGSRQIYLYEWTTSRWQQLQVPGSVVQVIGHPLSDRRLVGIFHESNRAIKLFGHLYESVDKGKTWLPASIDESSPDYLYQSLIYSRDKPGKIMAWIVSFVGIASYSTSEPGKWQLKDDFRHEQTLDEQYVKPVEGILAHYLKFSEIPKAIRSEYGLGGEWRKSAILHLIQALTDKDSETRHFTADALKEITKQDFGESYSKWRQWYEKNKEE